LDNAAESERSAHPDSELRSVEHVKLSIHTPAENRSHTDTALLASHAEMRSPQRLGHTAGRNPIHLHHKKYKNESPGKCRNQPFEGMKNTIDFGVTAEHLVLSFRFFMQIRAPKFLKLLYYDVKT
jgi:hypothetical protein